MEDLEFPNETKSIDSRKALSKKIAISSLAVSMILTLIAVVSAVSGSESSTTQAPSVSDWSLPATTDWAPEGFTVWRDDPNVAYKWAAKNNCDYYGCISAEFISKTGCPNSFYAALNWLDSADSVISYDNATLPRLNPMQIAKLRFDDAEGNSVSGQMAEINCR